MANFLSRFNGPPKILELDHLSVTVGHDSDPDSSVLRLTTFATFSGRRVFRRRRDVERNCHHCCKWVDHVDRCAALFSYLIVTTDQGARIDIAPGSILEDKVVTGNLRLIGRFPTTSADGRPAKTDAGPLFQITRGICIAWDLFQNSKKKTMLVCAHFLFFVRSPPREVIRLLELTRLVNDDLLLGLPGLRAKSLDVLDNVHALDDAAAVDVRRFESEKNVIRLKVKKTSHKTTCFPSSQAVGTVQMKNCEPLVLGPALAIERTPSPVCLSVKF